MGQMDNIKSDPYIYSLFNSGKTRMLGPSSIPEPQQPVS